MRLVAFLCLACLSLTASSKRDTQIQVMGQINFLDTSGQPADAVIVNGASAQVNILGKKEKNTSTICVLYDSDQNQGTLTEQTWKINHCISCLKKDHYCIQVVLEGELNQQTPLPDKIELGRATKILFDCHRLCFSVCELCYRKTGAETAKYRVVLTTDSFKP